MSNLFSSNVFGKVQDEDRQGEVFLDQVPTIDLQGKKSKKMYLESYGCAMNFSDSEIVASIMTDQGYTATSQINEADVVFINTCSIRDNAEQKIRARLKEFKIVKQRHKPDMVVGVLGCMAERLKAKLLEEEKLVDLVVGPDAYKDLANLLEQVDGGQKAVNVLLSREETYADITPVRLGGNGVLAFVTIMRGCDNMCSFCVVPFTRGRERSRDTQSIINEVKDLAARGYKDITLLGQNVDSYHWQDTNFAQLLEQCAVVDSTVRIRFSTSHPKDITDEVLHTMARHHNIAKNIHLPIQAGSTSMLKRMNRTYTRDWYINRIDKIKEILPNCGLSTDIIVGFCDETDDEHLQTLSIIEYVGYNFAYMFKYSERPGTLAHRKYDDNIPETLKTQRLNEIMTLQHQHSHTSNQKDVGKVFEVLIEGNSKKSDAFLCGRTSQNKMVVFPKTEGIEKGIYVNVLIERCTQATLLGKIVD